MSLASGALRKAREALVRDVLRDADVMWVMRAACRPGLAASLPGGPGGHTVAAHVAGLVGKHRVIAGVAGRLTCH